MSPAPTQGDVHHPDPLLGACRVLVAAMDDFDESACRRLGIGRTDLRALNLLEHGPLGAADLAARLGLSRAAVTALLDRLESAGYLRRTMHPDDRRARIIDLEPRLWRAMADIYRPLGEAVAAHGRAMSVVERESLAAQLLSLGTVFDDVRRG